MTELTESELKTEKTVDGCRKKYLDRLSSANPVLFRRISESSDPEEARTGLFELLADMERMLLSGDVHMGAEAQRDIRLNISVLRNLISPMNENRTGTSALTHLWNLINDREESDDSRISPGFVWEFINIFEGVMGRIESKESEPGGGCRSNGLQGREAAIARGTILDRLASRMNDYCANYPSGLVGEIIETRRKNRKRILEYFGGSEDDWNDHTWHMKNVIRETETLFALLDLTEERRRAVEIVVENKIPFGITPYYASLMDRKAGAGYDAAIRAVVFPSPEYAGVMAAHRENRKIEMDFMGERDTSPADLVTRRYPGIAIFKPFNSCPQICVYCQRNWEIDHVPTTEARASKKKLDAALDWFRRHEHVGDVLVTGGDPCVMPDAALARILDSMCEIEHIYRIRIGTRTPVVLPMRWSDDLVGILSNAHEPGRREIVVSTHFEHSSEITPEVLTAIGKIRSAGLGVYNQEVFILENSRRFESAKLRKDLRLAGVDPYYTFNMKGKKETSASMVPIARLLQERKEEARLVPGMDRTDEPVFNVPKIGKNYLRGWQDHDLIMIKPDGSRIYEFYHWETNGTPAPTYCYTDVPIYNYLARLAALGERIEDYSTIWQYF